jgi:subtilisin-like proprotein convertase family protein
MSGARQAVPYPSEIYVSVPGGAVTKATVTLNQLSHSWPGDLQMLLVGPYGHRVLLMSSAGGNNGISSPVTLTFSDAAVSTLPSGLITSGTYRPTRTGSGDFGSSAPPGPYSDALSVFNGTNPNGTWRLYMTDLADSFRGRIAGGWSLTLTIDPAATPSSAPPAPRPAPIANTAGPTRTP